MNKKFLLAAGLMMCACACQSNDQPNRQQDQKKSQTGGCCEGEKAQPPAQAEPKKETNAPQVVQQNAPQLSTPAAPAPQATAPAPAVKAETKTQ